MAGIGFNLRALSQHHSILAPFISLAHAAWASSGPLVLTAVCLLVVQLLAVERIPAGELTLFRAVLTYASMIALITASPIGLVVTRLVADSIYLALPTRIPALLAGATICAASLTGTAGIFVWSAFVALPANEAISAWILTQSFALLWIPAIVSGTLKDYVGVTGGFLVGALLASSVAMLLAQDELSTCAMMWSMSVANVTTALWLSARVLFAYPKLPTNAVEGAHSIARGLWQFPLLSLGAAMGALGIWVDKWVLWSSDLGRTVAVGLVYAPVYDSAMFIAFLVIVPALAVFIIYMETDLQVHVARFLSHLLNQGTLHEIQKAADRVGSTFRASLLHLFLVQAAMTACVMISLPLIVEALGMQFRQIPVLRLGLLGSLFHLLFLICSSVLLFINRQIAYCVLQIVFFLMNGLLSWAFLRLGSDLTAMGYFATTTTCGIGAYLWLDRTLRNLVYLTFAGVRPLPTTLNA